MTDIKGILNAMKNLALMEVKLGHFLSAQQRVVADIEEVAADIFSFYPRLLPPTAGAHPVFLLIGSERGFCGDFNESLLAEFDRCRSEWSVEEGESAPLLVTVGHKLAMKLGDGIAPDAVLAGPSVTEEVQSALRRGSPASLPGILPTSGIVYPSADPPLVAGRGGASAARPVSLCRAA